MAVIVGAAASIATPQKKWNLDAVLPADATNATRARSLVVSATREPELYVRRGQSYDRIQPKTSPATWPATVTYDVPAGTDIDRLVVAKGCGAGLCSGKCVPPADEYVRVDRVDVTSWTIESAETALARTMGKKSPRSIVTVEATREAELELTAPGMTYRPKIEPRGLANGRATFAVDFSTYGGAGDMQVTWSMRARISGPCTGACAPPAGEHVAIVGVADE